MKFFLLPIRYRVVNKKKGVRLVIAYRIFPQRLTYERLLLGFSQEKLCLLLNIPLESYRAFEAGTRFPNTDLWKLASFFHVSVDYLIGLTPKKRP